MCACSLSYQTCNGHAPYFHLRPVWFYRIFFSTLSHKRHNFRKMLLNIKCVFWFSLPLLSETFLIVRRTERYIIINVHRPSCKVILILDRFWWKTAFSPHIIEKRSNTKFHKNSSGGCRVVPCGQTEMAKLRVALRNYAKTS